MFCYHNASAIGLVIDLRQVGNVPDPYQTMMALNCNSRKNGGEVCHRGKCYIARRKLLKCVLRYEYLTVHFLKWISPINLHSRRLRVKQDNVQRYSTLAQKISADFLCDEGKRNQQLSLSGPLTFHRPLTIHPWRPRKPFYRKFGRARLGFPNRSRSEWGNHFLWCR